MTTRFNCWQNFPSTCSWSFFARSPEKKWVHENVSFRSVYDGQLQLCMYLLCDSSVICKFSTFSFGLWIYFAQEKNEENLYFVLDTGAHIRGGGMWGSVTPPMFCEMYLKSRSQNLNGTKKSVRLKSERHYHFVSKKRNRWTFWKWKLPKNNKNAYTNQEINHIILAANNQLSCCNRSANVMRSDYLKPPRCS
jgi:hypothetical protein